MRGLIIALIMLVTCCVFPAAAVTKGTPPQLPAGAMNATQVKSLFLDQSVVASSPEGKKLALAIHFMPNGQLLQVENGFQTAGKWKVRKDDRLCITLEGAKRDCRIIVKSGDVYQQYVVKKDGNHQHELTYVDFRKGNQLAKVSTVPILPKGTLDRNQIKALFTGKTVESVTASKGRISHSYYDADGSIAQVRNGVKRSGKWRVTKNGRICLQMENRSEKCRIIVKEGGEYKKYIVKKNGRHKHSVTYRNFADGESLGFFKR